MELGVWRGWVTTLRWRNGGTEGYWFVLCWKQVIKSSIRVINDVFEMFLIPLRIFGASNGVLRYVPWKSIHRRIIRLRAFVGLSEVLAAEDVRHSHDEMSVIRERRLRKVLS